MVSGRTQTVPIALAVGLCAVLLSGCAAPLVTLAGSIAGADFDVSDPSDACRAQRQELKSYQDYFTRSMLEGAAIGTAVGAAAGYLIGGNATGALVGAGAGAVLGGTTGYYVAKQRANSDQGALTRSIYQDVSTENGEIDNVTAAFKRLRDCRFQAAKMIKADYAAGRLTEDEAKKQLSQVRAKFQQDIAFAEDLGAKMDARGKEYRNASDELVKLDPNAPRQARRTPSQPPVKAAGGSGIVATVAARVRAEPDANASLVATLAAGESVTVVGSADGEWTRVQIRDGRDGYVASRLLGPAAAAAKRTQVAAAAPPRDATGVAQLTESNQFKRKALADDVQSAKVAANSEFELSGRISELPAGRRAA